MVSNIFYFHPYLGKIPILTNIFQRGWFNHQLDLVFIFAKSEVNIIQLCPLTTNHGPFSKIMYTIWPLRMLDRRIKSPNHPWDYGIFTIHEWLIFMGLSCRVNIQSSHGFYGNALKPHRSKNTQHFTCGGLHREVRCCPVDAMAGPAGLRTLYMAEEFGWKRTGEEMKTFWKWQKCRGFSWSKKVTTHPWSTPQAITLADYERVPFVACCYRFRGVFQRCTETTFELTRFFMLVSGSCTIWAPTTCC